MCGFFRHHFVPNVNGTLKDEPSCTHRHFAPPDSNRYDAYIQIAKLTELVPADAFHCLHQCPHSTIAVACAVQYCKQLEFHRSATINLLQRQLPLVTVFLTCVLHHMSFLMSRHDSARDRHCGLCSFCTCFVHDNASALYTSVVSQNAIQMHSALLKAVLHYRDR